MKDWWSISDLHDLGCEALIGQKNLHRFAKENLEESSDHCRDVDGGGGAKGSKREYHRAILPPVVQREIVRRDQQAKLKEMQSKTDAEVRNESLWEAYWKVSVSVRAKAEERLDIVNTRLPGLKIAVAQWRLVNGLDPYVNYTLRSYAERLTDHIRLFDMKPADWIVVMNALGERIRHEVKRVV